MLIQIPIKLPWSFEKALGYPKGFRWVAFYWEPCGDEVMYDDGYCSATGNWSGFLRFINHPRVSPWLGGYNLGSSEDAADHWLLCDLEARDVLVGDRVEVKEVLIKEIKKYVPSTTIFLTSDDFTEIINKVKEDMAKMPTPTLAEIQEKMIQDQAMVNKLVLDLWAIS